MPLRTGEIRRARSLTGFAWLVSVAVVCLAAGPAPLGADSVASGGPGEGGGSEKPSSDAEEAAPALENTLRWKTASEVDNFGFDVYRADSEEGPFERLTEEPIPGAGTTDEPQQYVFVDDTIEAGKAYWYYVESISMSGVRERFTPVFRAAPKGGDAADEADPDSAEAEGEGEDAAGDESEGSARIL